MKLNEAMRFDKRLQTRHLRQGTLLLDELQNHLASLEDEAHLAILPDDPSNQPAAEESEADPQDD